MPDHKYACDAVGMLHVIVYSLLSIPSYHYKEAQALQQSFEHYTVHLYTGVHVPHIIHMGSTSCQFSERNVLLHH